MKKKNYSEIFDRYRAKCLALSGGLTARQMVKLEEEIFNSFVEGNIKNEIEKHENNK